MSTPRAFSFWHSAVICLNLVDLMLQFQPIPWLTSTLAAPTAPSHCYPLIEYLHVVHTDWIPLVYRCNQEVLSFLPSKSGLIASLHILQRIAIIPSCDCVSLGRVVRSAVWNTQVTTLWYAHLGRGSVLCKPLPVIKRLPKHPFGYLCMWPSITYLTYRYPRVQLLHTLSY